MWNIMIDVTDTKMLNGVCINKNNMCSVRYKGGGTSTKTVSSLSPEQREALNTVFEWASPYLKSTTAGATYPGQLVAETPDLFNLAYKHYAGGQYGELETQAIKDLMSGKPAYEFSPVKTATSWRETYAEPAMQAWRETVAPIVKETMNMPGTYYSRGTSDYLAQKAGEFYGSKIAPSLYSSLISQEAMGAQSCNKPE